jgi:hypothetical protein
MFAARQVRDFANDFLPVDWPRPWGAAFFLAAGKRPPGIPPKPAKTRKL